MSKVVHLGKEEFILGTKPVSFLHLNVISPNSSLWWWRRLFDFRRGSLDNRKRKVRVNWNCTQLVDFMQQLTDGSFDGFNLHEGLILNRRVD